MKTFVYVPATTTGVRRRLEATSPRQRLTKALVALLTAIALLALPTCASAATREMRGEWELVVNSGGTTAHAQAIIRQEANANGEFAASSVIFEGTVQGTFSGTLGASEASVTITTQPFYSYPATEFKSSTIAIDFSSAHPTLSGSGTMTAGGNVSSATMTATRIRTYQELVEIEEREQRELEEREARENVRGEWSLVLKSGPQALTGTARITQAANNSTNEFASSSALFESIDPGSFLGTLEGAKATVTVTTEAMGSLPASTFTSNSIVVQSTATSMSMSGSGTVTFGQSSAPATLEATRVKDYAELKALEIAEQEAKEAKEREAREAKERLEREAREKLEREAAAKQTSTATTTTPPTMTTPGGSITVAAVPASEALTLSPSGELAVRLDNPDSIAVEGRLTLLFAARHKGKAAAKHKRAKPLVFGTATFSIPAGGHITVHVKLSRAARALLGHRGALSAIAKIVTRASGESGTSKTYAIKLRTPAHAHHR